MGALREEVDSLQSERAPVDVVMLTWNKLELTRRAIESYRRHVRYPHRLICVDNGSTDGTLEYLRSAADLVVANSSNVGAVRARNQGWAVSQSEYVLFSDNDVEFECDVVAPLVAAMEREPRLGVVGPLLNEKLLQIGKYPADASIAEITGVVLGARCTELNDADFVQACLMMVRRATVAEVGAFHNDFDPYAFEEFDLAQRALARGWRVAVACDSYAHHHGTGARALPERDAIVERSRQVFLRRWALKVNDDFKGVVKPFPLSIDDVAAAEPTPRLGDHLKLVERAVAGCRLGPDWPQATEEFVVKVPASGQDQLVLGCGAAEAVKVLRHRFSLRAVGLTPALTSDDVYGVRQGWGFALPFDDSTFDGVICRHSLEHSPMPVVDLMESARVLRPRGLAVLSLPVDREPAPGDMAIYAPFSDPQWRRLFRQAGFAVRDVRAGFDAGNTRYVLQKDPLA